MQLTKAETSMGAVIAIGSVLAFTAPMVMLIRMMAKKERER